MQKEVESAVDVDASAVHVQKSQIAVDAEQELAKVDLTLHSETLKDTAPVLEGIKVNSSQGWGRALVLARTP